MLESRLEEKLSRAVKRAGGKTYKFVSPGNAGVPDRIVVLPQGRIAFVELKQRGEKPRPLQMRQIAELNRLGCMALYIDRAEQIDGLMFWLTDCREGSGLT